MRKWRKRGLRIKACAPNITELILSPTMWIGWEMTQMAPCYQNTLIASIIATRKGSFLAHKGNQIVAHSTLPYCTSKQMSGCPIAEKGVLLCNIMQIYNYVWKTRRAIAYFRSTPTSILPTSHSSILLSFHPSILCRDWMHMCRGNDCACAHLQ